MHDNVVLFAPEGDKSIKMNEHIRIIEAIIFASNEPVSEKLLASLLPDGCDLKSLLQDVRELYISRGVNLVQVGSGWAFRTAHDLSFLMRRETVQQKKLSRAALEVLSIIAYHQPVTRAEIQEIRGVDTSKGTLDVLMESQWIKIRGRRKTPGRPVTYGTTDDFLDHFGIPEISDLPGMDELKGAGLLSGNIPKDFSIPSPVATDELMDDEEQIGEDELEEFGLLSPLDDDSSGQ